MRSRRVERGETGARMKRTNALAAPALTVASLALPPAVEGEADLEVKSD